MSERLRLDRDRMERAPEETAIESWVEDLGIYLLIPSGDATGKRRHRRDPPPTASPLRDE